MDEVEAVARAICATRGLSPDALYQHHEWEPWPIDRRDEYVGLDGEVRINLMHYAWRRHTERAEAAIAALDAARGKAEPVARALTDPQRMLWKDDVEGICPSIDLCFEYGDTARCWPCAAKQSASLGVSVDTSQPNLPEVSRLRRELKAQGDRVAQVVEWLREKARNDIESAKYCRRGNAGQTLRRFAQRRLMDADAIERGEPFNG